MGTFFPSPSSSAKPPPSLTPPLSSSMGRSPLLELPPELRNMIYERALSYEDGLAVIQMTPESGSPITLRPRNADDGPIANPLKLVCRQFKKEMHNLALKVNKVHYQELNGPQSEHYSRWPYVKGSDVDRDCGRPIRKLFIQANYDEDYPTQTRPRGQLMVQAYELLDEVHRLGLQVSVAKWKSYGQSHPLCEVQWALDPRPFGVLDQRAVLNWMIALELVITGKSLLMLPESSRAYWIQKAHTFLEVYRNKDTGKVALPTNFRLLIDAPFPEEQVLDIIRGQQAMGLLTESQAWATTEQVRTVFKQGIRGCETAEMRKARKEQDSSRIDSRSEK